MNDWKESVRKQSSSQDGSQWFQEEESLMAVGIFAGFVTKKTSVEGLEV